MDIQREKVQGFVWNESGVNHFVEDGGFIGQELHFSTLAYI